MFKSIIPLVISIMTLQGVLAQTVTVTAGSPASNPAKTCVTTSYDVDVTQDCSNMVHLGNTVNISGFNITINMNYTIGIVCIWQTTYTTQTVSLGSLPVGSYNVTMNGQIMGTTVSTITRTLNVQACCPYTTGFTQSADSVCPGDSVFFTNTSTGPYTTISWKKNGVVQTSLQNYADSFGIQGPNWVQLVLDDGSCIDSLTKEVYVHGLPNINLGNDTTLCDGKWLNLSAGANRDSVIWWDQSVNTSKVVDSAGTYYVDVYEKGCSSSDSIIISILPSPKVDIGSDTSLCMGSTYILDATSPGVTYKWHDNSTLPTYTVTGFGVYSVTVTNSSNCSDNDQIFVNELPLPQVSLGKDSILCQGDTLLLDASGTTGATYNWHDGFSGAAYPATSTNIYWVEVTDTNGCTGIDSVSLGFINCHIGIEENELTKMRIYPLPASTGFTVMVPQEVSGQVKYEIVDMSGKELQEGRTTIASDREFRVEISNLESGLYIFRLRHEKGTYNERLVIN